MQECLILNNTTNSILLYLKNRYLFGCNKSGISYLNELAWFWFKCRNIIFSFSIFIIYKMYKLGMQTFILLSAFLCVCCILKCYLYYLSFNKLFVTFYEYFLKFCFLQKKSNIVHNNQITFILQYIISSLYIEQNLYILKYHLVN